MTVRTTILALALSTAVLPQAVSAESGTTNPLLLPANKIVGLWSTAAAVGPCGGPPVMQVVNNLLFHAGGTLTENIAPTPDRNQGLGTWSYQAGTGWQLHLRFDRFSEGVNTGFTTVDRTLSMSRDGPPAHRTGSSHVLRARRHAALRAVRGGDIHSSPVARDGGYVTAVACPPSSPVQ